MKSKLERKALHTTDLKTTKGAAKNIGRNRNRERIYHKGQKTYKEIDRDGQKYYVKLDIKEN